MLLNYAFKNGILENELKSVFICITSHIYEVSYMQTESNKNIYKYKML